MPRIYGDYGDTAQILYDENLPDSYRPAAASETCFGNVLKTGPLEIQDMSRKHALRSHWTGPNQTTDLETGLDMADRSRENLPLHDATGRQFLDCGDQCWICSRAAASTRVLEYYSSSKLLE